MEKFKSDVSGKEFPGNEKVAATMIRQPIYDVIKQENPFFDDSCHLSVTEHNQYREKYITEFLQRELGELSETEAKVVESLKNKTLLADDPDDDDAKSTFGQRIADKVASFGGSWTFIIIFVSILIVWIGGNVLLLTDKGFDPYPFILLNLILSCVAALQAPVIMMSQNRQGEKDREKAQNDYMVNLKSELEIRMLHEKIDHLVLHQEQSLIEIQRVQIEMMNDILKRMEQK
jgi:uncharacterized membrane protein